MARLNASQAAQLYGRAGPLSQGPWNDASVIRSSPNMASKMRLVGILNGRPVYMLVSAPPQLPSVSNSKRKRKFQLQVDDDQPQAKKPLNAFMVYLREQRRTVQGTLQGTVQGTVQGTSSAAVNKVLGDRWKQLSDDQRAKYYDQAQREARLQAPLPKTPGLPASPPKAPSAPEPLCKAPSLLESLFPTIDFLDFGSEVLGLTS